MSDQPEPTSIPADTPAVVDAPAAPEANVVPPSPATQAGLSVLLEREAAAEARSAELKAREAKVAQWEKIEAMSPAEKARALGLSLSDIQKSMVDSYDPNEAVTAKLTALEQKIAERDAARERERLEAAYAAETSKVRTFIDESEEFLITKANGYHDTVVEAVKLAAKSGKNLSEAEAASNVEAGLFDLVAKAMAIPAVRDRILGKQAEAVTETPTSTPLTNRTASNSAQPRIEGNLLSEDDALDRFVAMLS